MKMMTDYINSILGDMSIPGRDYDIRIEYDFSQKPGLLDEGLMDMGPMWVDEDRIHEVEINIDPADWSKLHFTFKPNKLYVRWIVARLEQGLEGKLAKGGTHDR